MWLVEMVLSVSDVVADVLKTMHYLKPAMKLGVVNYSALARVIRPIVEEKIGDDVELETIIMAIRRNASVFTREPAPTVFDVLKDSKVELCTGVAYVKVKRKPGVYEQLVDLAKTVNAEEMENVYVIQRTDEISIVLPEHAFTKVELLPAIKKDRSIIIAKRSGLALITVTEPPIAPDVPGVYAMLTSLLSDSGISTLTMLGSFSRVSFLLKDEDAPTAYDKINKLIRESKKLAALSEKH
ncbi:MAG: hypothetical protein QW343_01820 [Candidatus Norongarragalinales archaeon]